MSDKKELPISNIIKVRDRAKKKKPSFVRPESWRYDRISPNWRRPRGLDHKVRRKIKGWPPGPSTGYKGPNAVRGLHPSGYKEILVFNVDDVNKINIETQAGRISRTVGKRKKIQIVAAARECGVHLLNAKIVKVEDESENETESTLTENDEIGPISEDDAVETNKKEPEKINNKQTTGDSKK